jgi:hypothetical protein
MHRFYVKPSSIAFNKHRDFLEGLATQGEGLYGIAGIFNAS